ncbi:MAG: copper homeostasis protein CutC [Bacteroidales bacterium]|jgi:copper homeostasis protein|nr:copper homeostasis protein CutC [Bacteroidales bacterium]MCK9498777.1 copper homeostasis protein CutC [Bacteroidales bacterium]MDY0315432.1 copper homeostasis protein CutC [Bacteroidales bacterium]NLB85900.1 copper homeostasis protein CutC [Bacteroidales bacterium]
MKKVLEICCDSINSVENANIGGAQRIELCTALQTGGLSPTYSFLNNAVKISKIPINALLRPRAGNFVYSDAEFQIMCEELEEMKKAGATGIVSGVLLPNGRIDKHRTKELLDLSKPLNFTFHRAIDFCTDIDEAMEFLCDIGAERVLSSGGFSKIDEGIESIIELHKKYGKKICIMPGGGLNIENAKILKDAGIYEFHFSASEFEEEKNVYSRFPNGLGHVISFEKYGYNYSSQNRIKKMLELLLGF